MNPRAVLAWALGAVVVALATGNPVYRGLVALVALNVLLRHRRAGVSLRPLAAGLAFAMVLSIALNLVLAHAGDHVLARIPDRVPALGGPLTLESVAYGGVTALGIAAAVLACSALSVLLEPDEVVGALPRALERTGAAVAASLALAPALGRSFRSVREAQAVRGWRPRGPRSWSHLLVPVVLTAVEDSVQLAEAMEARGFGTGPRTRLRPPAWTAGDAVATAAAGAAAAVFAATVLAGRLPAWYPYPTLSPPPTDPILVAGCLLLAVPLLPWNWRSSNA